MENTNIKLELTIDETNQVLAGLGELPSKTGAWNLIVKIHQQAQPQLPKPEETKDEDKSESK